MKPMKIEKRLNLKKKTIANLSIEQLNRAKGGCASEVHLSCPIILSDLQTCICKSIPYTDCCDTLPGQDSCGVAACGVVTLPLD